MEPRAATECDPAEDQSDELLWRQATAGDSGAFGLVFDRHAQAVYRHCQRLLASIPDAQDATSIVFMEAWRHRLDVRFVDASVRPWLLVTATNVVRNLTRATRRYDAVLARLPRGTGAVTDIAEEVVDNLAALELAEQLRTAITRLRRHEAEAIALCDLAEMSYADAAAALHISLGTLKSRLSRGRARLRSLLRDEPDEPMTQDDPTGDLLSKLMHTSGGTS